MTSSVRKSRIHLWSPGLFEFKGGIQTFSRYLCESLAEVLPQVDQDIFSLHDRQTPVVVTEHPLQGFHCFGKIPAKVRIPSFAAAVLTQGLLKRPNLIISTHLNLGVVAHYLKKLTGIPYWVVAHGFEAWHIQKQSVIDTLVNADRVLAVSHYTRQQLIQNYDIPPERISIFPNTFDSSKFQVAPKPKHLLKKYGLNEKQPVILTVNRLEAGEDFRPYDQVIQALPLIQASVPNIHYLIVGNGNDRERLQQEIIQNNLEQSVTLAGFIPDEDLSAHYNLCDLYAMPSKLEGFGIVFLEALASGKPVMASRLDGGRDALCDGKLGALVNPESIEEIAACAVDILSKTYPNPLMYSPHELRQSAIATFGKEQFNHNLACQFRDFDFHANCLVKTPLLES